MNVVIAIDSFKGSMTSLEAGESASAGIRRIYPDADITIRPLADGGEGTVEALTLGCGGTRTQVCVTGPLEKPVLCSYGILDAGKTAVIEMSGAAGITLLSETERNPLYTTTYGVGEVIRDAISRGCRHFIIGIGGSATNDGGIGMLQALGFDLLDQEGVPVRHGALGLKDLAVISDSHALPELKECTFRIACDVTNPLCGSQGCSAVFGSSKRRRSCHDPADGSVAFLLCRTRRKKLSENESRACRSRGCRRSWVCFSHLFPCHSGIRCKHHSGRNTSFRLYKKCRYCHHRRRLSGWSDRHGESACRRCKDCQRISKTCACIFRLRDRGCKSLSCSRN